MRMKALRTFYLLICHAMVMSLFMPVALAQPADVRAALTLVKQWQLNKPSFYARMDVEGQFIKQVAHFYCYPVNGGRIWKVDNYLIQPNEAHMILEETPGDIVAYFPEINKHVLTKILPGDADIIGAGFQGLNDVEAVLAATKSSALKTTGDVNELTLVFDPKKIGVHPVTADITIIAKFDHTGRINEIEQRRLGLKQVARITYITFNPAEVQAQIPVTPDPALATANMSYEDAIQESIIFFAKAKQRQRNRL